MDLKKCELVEKSFRNGEEIVFYSEDTDEIYVCFGGCEVKDNTIQFKDCSIADIEEGQEEYYGEVLNESLDVYFRLKDKINPNFVPTIFFKGEMVEVICLK